MIVIIPAYQPDEKMVRLVEELRRKTDFRILIVDDGSDSERQGFFSAVEDGATVLHHEVNRGKGAAIKTALAYVLEHHPEEEGVVTIDADGQHLVKDIIRVVDDWRGHRDDLVIGSRRFTGKVPFKSRAGNAITRFVFHVSTGVKVYDTQTGLRAFSMESVPSMLEIRGDRYEYEINVLLYATKKKMHIREVTIDTVYIEDNASSHFHPVRDAWRIYKTILLFVASSLVSFLVDVLAFALFSLILGGTGLERDLSRAVAEVAARVVSSLCNFKINKELVFEGKGKACIVRYFILAVGILALDYGILTLLVDVLGFSNVPAKILSGVVCYPVSFLMQRIFVFKEKKD